MSPSKGILSIFRKNKYVLAITIIVALLLLFVASRSIAMMIKRANSENVLVEIKAGSSPEQIANELKDKEIIDSVFFFKLQVRLTGSASKLKAGLYSFKPSSSISSVIKKISNGEVEVYEDIRVTIPEGYNIKQMGELFEQKLKFTAEDFYQEIKSIDLPYEWAKLIPEGLIYKYEGYLFPDTYDFSIASTPSMVINRLAARFNQVIASKYNESDIKDKYTLHQALTLASVVEKEAVLDVERKTIASVFYNRLNIGQALQSCATVQYVLPEHREVLSTEDTETESPFNTYMYTGLPPGPISTIGGASFSAILAPEDTNYYYFFAIGGGKHYFSKTYLEHLRAIKKYK